MDDYYGFAAFFSQIGRKGTDDPREIDRLQQRRRRGDAPGRRPGDEAEVPRRRRAGRGGQGPPRGAGQVAGLAGEPVLRHQPGQHRLGPLLRQGIIDEVDDVRVSNPASNPELLDELGKQFTEYKYDFKKLVRDICTSRTYQLATQPNDEQRGRHAQLRPRPTSAASRPRRSSTASAQVTETKNKFPGLPLGARAVQIADGSVSTYFLTTFGRATRETVCSCEVQLEPTLSQSLHLLNGDTTTQQDPGRAT